MSASGATSSYKDTVLLPETPFPPRANAAVREPEIIAKWLEDKLYERIQETRKSAPLYVLHDGPPYSNGQIHYGHILNKILKDLVVKSRTMMGHRAPFVPGWDTHGLPIELAVEREIPPAKRAAMAPSEIRAACRAYALKFVDIQREEFKRLGVLGDWERPYLTLDHTYEGAIAHALAKFTRDGYLYRGHKPVSWCPRDMTALAEAEIEYADKTSPSVYVRMPVIDRQLAGKPFAFLIWTTTPWTLPANLAIVANPRFDYVLIANPKHAGENLLVARALAESVAAAIGGDASTAVAVGKDELLALEGARYQHPFITTAPVAPEQAWRLWFADYVEDTAGTGLVHTAPGHGADDYRTGVAKQLPPYAPLDDRARYTDGVKLERGAEAIELTGTSTDDANPIIVKHLHDTGYLLNPPTDSIKHSYQHCWRCHRPIVYRATPQWFIAMDHAEFRTRALAEIDQTTWIPPWGHDRIYAMIEKRPDWVLSRQRLWGTPIPTFHCTGCNAAHADADTMDFVAEIFDREGADAWWSRSVAELVPPGTTCKQCGAGADKLEREKDIVDVWFESGVSWLAMARRADVGADYQKIDLYLEGSDQHRGWFHSSLLAALGVKGTRPYHSVITHGFVLDENGIPYSKSTIAAAKAAGKKTSYIEPSAVIAKSGTEMFRLWAASTEYRNDITYSQAILDGLATWYGKYRNTAKFLLGNIADFDPDKFGRGDVTRAVDRYMLGRLDEVVREIRVAYDNFEFHVVHRKIVELVTVDISAFYGDVFKDLYCEAVESPRRRAAQVVLYECLRAITTLYAPIVCFTAEDIWSHMPKRAGDPASVHEALFVEGTTGSNDLAGDFAVILAWRERVTKAVEPFRAQKHKSTDAAITITCSDADRAVLARHASELPEIFIVSQVTLAPAVGESVEVVQHPGVKCMRCWRHYEKLAAEPADVCERCAGALAAIDRKAAQ